jgi:hypothetical protein
MIIGRCEGVPDWQPKSEYGIFRTQSGVAAEVARHPSVDGWTIGALKDRKACGCQLPALPSFQPSKIRREIRYVGCKHRAYLYENLSR